MEAARCHHAISGAVTVVGYGVMLCEAEGGGRWDHHCHNENRGFINNGWSGNI